PQRQPQPMPKPQPQPQPGTSRAPSAAAQQYYSRPQFGHPQSAQPIARPNVQAPAGRISAPLAPQVRSAPQAVHPVPQAVQPMPQGHAAPQVQRVAPAPAPRAAQPAARSAPAPSAPSRSGDSTNPLGR
ncbi:MAG TPA: hypothetical protein VLS49_14425, partial [Usitatibacter sp.]|nr:hypothetical protein [Usitatibacter sp.]